MNLQARLASIPYLPPHHIAVSEEDEGTIVARMPFRREITNYVGSVHAGALFTLAETAAGVAATAVVSDGRAFVLLRGASIRYTRRAQSDLAAIARVPAEGAAKSRVDFDAEGRADVLVPVTITDADGAPVLEASFDYALRQVKR
ncbi:MAG: DUF4442 domain-containing protein [Hyphomicrobiaceae bacterium]|nr:MAG: DUF4442 domain-containing protein [Hyphomicrobiaceae bacterium]